MPHSVSTTIGEIKADFIIVTPMFLGGHKPNEQTAAIQIRPTAIKGALRYWWRALNWSHIFSPGDLNKSLADLHKQEAAIFGSCSPEPSQSKFLLSITKQTLSENINNTGYQQYQGCKYLLGQGLFQHKTKTVTRKYIEGDFSITIRYRKNALNQEQVHQLYDSLLLMGLIGSLGARARRGWGSLSLSKLDHPIHKIPTTSLEYYSLLKTLIPTRHVDQPPFTAFSQATRLIKAYSADKSETVLEEIGKALLLFRTNGRQGKIDTRNLENKKIFKLDKYKQFWDDHDLMLKVANSGKTHHKHPKRVVFGLPHNYCLNRNNKIDIEGCHEHRKRRASPLFIYVHKIENIYLGMLLLLPADFLPQEDKISFKRPNTTQSLGSTPHQVDYTHIHSFFNHFVNKQEVINAQ